MSDRLTDEQRQAIEQTRERRRAVSESRKHVSLDDVSKGSKKSSRKSSGSKSEPPSQDQ